MIYDDADEVSDITPLMHSPTVSPAPDSTDHEKYGPDPAYQKQLARPGLGAFLLSTRFRLAIVGLIGFLIEYALRTDMSVAMVCMVNHTAIAQHHEHKDPDGLDAKCTVVNGTKDEDGPYAWEKVEQGYVLSSFFWGYIITQIPAGMLAERVGGKPVIFFAMLLAGVGTLLCPLAASIHIDALIALRVLIGMVEGVMFPAFHCIWSNWAPPLERSLLVALCYSGAQLGNVVALSVSGTLCATIGWEYIFYLFGGLCIIWCALWFWVASSTPTEHLTIGDSELQYITQSLKGQQLTRIDSKARKPWFSMVTSWPVWGIIVMHTGANFGNYMPLTELPTYMSDVLRFDEQANGLWSAMPYILYFITMSSVGFFADQIRTRGWLSTKNVRKLAMIISMVGQSAFFVAAGYIDCTQKMWGVIFLTLAQGISGIYAAGFLVNHVDIAPRYAGTLFGISNMAATIPGIVAPYMVSAITPDGTREQWQIVFWIGAAILMSSLFFYLLTASGDLQDWARPDYDVDKGEKAARGRFMARIKTLTCGLFG